MRLDHLRHHSRFYISVLCGIAVWLLPLGGTEGLRAPLVGATFFVIYLATTFWTARRLTTEHFRAKANLDDEGIGLIVLITLGAIVLSLSSLALLLGKDGRPSWTLIPAVANVPLGWATLHTVMAFHYAHLFYSPDEKHGKRRDAEGLEFPGTKEPSIFDFVYYSFVVGMTAQVSDVDVTSREMRNMTTVHGVVSFFYNTVILAFALNVLTNVLTRG